MCQRSDQPGHFPPCQCNEPPAHTPPSPSQVVSSPLPRATWPNPIGRGGLKQQGGESEPDREQEKETRGTLMAGSIENSPRKKDMPHVTRRSPCRNTYTLSIHYRKERELAGT